MSVKFTKPQLKKLIEVVRSFSEISDMIGNTPKFSEIRFYHHPVFPKNIYLKYRIKGVSAGEMYNDVKYVCVNNKGGTEKCLDLLETSAQKMQFTLELEEFVLDNGKPVWVKD